MSNWKKTFEKVMAAQSDASINFDDLCHLLNRLGYSKRQSGSHIIFTKSGLDRINLQSRGSQAKPYQVKQVREQFTKNKIHP